MKELWIRKAIYRRYLIEDDDIDVVKAIIDNEPERSDELIGDIYDKNNNVEYDEEVSILPVDYSIRDLSDQLQTVNCNEDVEVSFKKCNSNVCILSIPCEKCPHYY